MRRGCCGWGLEPHSASTCAIGGGCWDGVREWDGGHSSWKRRAVGWDSALSPAPTPSPSLSMGLIALQVPQPHPAPSSPPSPAPGPSTAPPHTWAAPRPSPILSFSPPHSVSQSLSLGHSLANHPTNPILLILSDPLKTRGGEGGERKAKQLFSHLPQSAAGLSDEQGGLHAIWAHVS